MTSYFGNNPLSDAIDSLYALGMARLEELTCGFGTNQVFDVSFFAEMEKGNSLFNLTALKSQTEYGFIVRAGTVTEQSVQVAHIATCGNLLDQKNWRMMTLTRGDRGQIHARPGWGS